MRPGFCSSRLSGNTCRTFARNLLERALKKLRRPGSICAEGKPHCIVAIDPEPDIAGHGFIGILHL